MKDAEFKKLVRGDIVYDAGISYGSDFEYTVLKSNAKKAFPFITPCIILGPYDKKSKSIEVEGQYKGPESVSLGLFKTYARAEKAVKKHLAKKKKSGTKKA